MEFAIINENRDIRFASTTEMRLLFTYICDPYMEVDYTEVGDFIHIYDLYDDNCEFFVKIKKDKLRKILKQWEEISEGNAKNILVKKEDEDFVFEDSEYGVRGGWLRQTRAVDIEGLSFEKSNIFNKLKEPFNGECHYILQEDLKKSKFINKYCDQKGVVTSDIKFQKDFTVNHVFFPEGLTADDIRQKIIESLGRLTVKKYVEVKDKVFSFYDRTKEGIIIQTIINNKGEILTAYPIFGRME